MPPAPLISHVGPNFCENRMCCSSSRLMILPCSDQTVPLAEAFAVRRCRVEFSRVTLAEAFLSPLKQLVEYDPSIQPLQQCARCGCSVFGTVASSMFSKISLCCVGRPLWFEWDPKNEDTQKVSVDATSHCLSCAVRPSLHVCTFVCWKMKGDSLQLACPRVQFAVKVFT